RRPDAGADLGVAQAHAVGRTCFVMVRPEGSDLDDLPPDTNVNGREPATDNARAAKQALYFFRLGISGDVKVLRMSAQQQIPHTAANQKSTEACFVQLTHDTQRRWTDILARNIVLISGNNEQGGVSGFALGSKII